MSRRASALDGLDDDHAPAAARATRFMSLRQTETVNIAAVKARFTAATAYRIEQDPRLFPRKGKCHATAGRTPYYLATHRDQWDSHTQQTGNPDNVAINI
jgi:hypothetical protein